jgi:hypothetical protein
VLSLDAAMRRRIRALPAISSARASFTLASIALPVNALIETQAENAAAKSHLSAGHFNISKALALTDADLLGVKLGHSRRRGYRTVVHISGRQPIAGDYPEGQWSQAKADLEDALRQHRCDVFTINALIWTEIGLDAGSQFPGSMPISGFSPISRRCPALSTSACPAQPNTSPPARTGSMR